MFATIVLPLIGLFLIYLFFSDPFFLFQLVAVIYERRLKKQMPLISVSGQKLFKYALMYGDENAQRTAKLGVLFQWIYAYLWAVTLLGFTAIFLYQRQWGIASMLLVIALLFCYWGTPFFWLWRKNG